MKKITLLFASLLCVAYIAVAQLKLYVYQNDGTRTEFVASTVDSIAFGTVVDTPNQPDVPNQPDEPTIPDDPAKPEEIIERKLYFVNTEGWNSVGVYTWIDGTVTSNAQWPGEYATIESTVYGYYVYSYDMTGKEQYNMIIFNNGVGGTGGQTLDLNIDYSKPYYCVGKWYSSLDDIVLCSISFNSNGGSGTMSSVKIEKSGSYTIPSNSFTRSGYEFVGWNTKADGTGTSYSKNQIIHIYDLTDLTLYAQWKKLYLYALSFNSNGGTGTMSSIETNRFEESVRIPSCSFTRSGCEFICWNTKADGTGINYEKGDLFVVSDDTLYAQWYNRKELTSPHEYVDLGLSVRWATCNVGATKPEETGYFFSWGETKPKAKYNWSTYKWCEGSSDTQTKYCIDSDDGTVDHKTVLELYDDAANANWRDNWRMPTVAEQYELITKCTWTFTTQNGVKGYKVISKTNGNSIFLPAAGMGRENSNLKYAGLNGAYWSSSLNTDSSTGQSYCAYYLGFHSSWVGFSEKIRSLGLLVRPVK